MKCPICGKELELQKKQSGVDDTGEPVFSQYAICRSCKKQWNLDKQRAKKRAAEQAANHSAEAKIPEQEEIRSDNTKLQNETEPSVHSQVSTKDRKNEDTQNVAKHNAKADNSADPQNTVKHNAKAGDSSDPEKAEPRYANIPPEKIRVKKEKAVKQAYEDMLAADQKRKPKKKKKKREDDISSETISQKRASVSETKEVPKPKFRILRILIGLVCVAAFGYFIFKGALAGLDLISNPAAAGSGTTYLVLALCLLVSGLLLFIMQKRRTIFAFILPMLFTLGGCIYTLLQYLLTSIQYQDAKELFFGAVLSGFLALLLLIFAVLSKTSARKDREDDDDE